MKMKKTRQLITIIFALLLPSLVFAGEWENLGLRQTGIDPSDEKGSTRYTLQDHNNREFEVNYAETPMPERCERVVFLKDTFYSWTIIVIERMEFFFSSDAIQANLKITRAEWEQTDLIPYLPAGLSFQDRHDGLYYNFRIVVDFQSYMLEGKYTDEPSLLAAIYSFIKEKEEEPAGTVQSAEPETTTAQTTTVSEEPVTHRVSIFGAPVYLIPTFDLSKKLESGFGVMLGVTLHDVGISLSGKTVFDVDFTLATGYWGLSAKGGQGDTSSEVKSAFIIPLVLSARYPFVFYDRFFVAPVLSTGINYNSIDYYEPVAGGGEQLVEIRAFAPSLGMGAQFGYYLMDKKLALLAGVHHSWMFERHMTPSIFALHIGAEYTFTVLGK